MNEKGRATQRTPNVRAIEFTGIRMSRYVQHCAVNGYLVEMNEKHRVFLLPQRAAIGRVLYTLYQSEVEPCYPTKIHRTMTDPSYATVYDAIQQFKDHDWITQATNDSHKKPISLTDDGTAVFTALVDFMEVLDTDAPRP